MPAVAETGGRATGQLTMYEETDNTKQKNDIISGAAITF